jgi:type III pantothenate kinase
MLLAIDVGNTNSKFALYEGETLKAMWRLRTDANRTADEYALALTQLMGLRGFDIAQIKGCIIATVVPATLFNLRRLCATYLRTEPMVIGEPGVDLGMQVKIDRPQDVGADRLVDAVSAYRKHGGPLIIVAFGSGTTFNVVDKDGNYCGGAIAPGVNLSIEAFYLLTARLPRIRVEKPAQVIGKATVPAMQSGIFWGYVGLIESLITRIKREYGEPMKVVATGALAALFEAETHLFDVVEPQLTLDGLQQTWARNRGK